jgi:hypothetical protein
MSLNENINEEANEIMREYLESLFHIFLNINTSARKRNDQKGGMISLIIYNYIKEKCTMNNIALQSLETACISNNASYKRIHLESIFNYIRDNEIELYDLKTMKEDTIDTNNPSHIERFVLSHVYYITQCAPV